MKEDWRFIDTGINDGFLNMAIDEAILDTHISGFCPPTLRVYRWDPSALTLGYFQNVEREIETKKCLELGIDIVRRPTGGQAVLHHDELTYSIVTSGEYGFPNKSIAESYRLLNEGLISAYKSIGLEVRLVQSEKSSSSSACFLSTGLADLTFQGRKIAGSAQVRRSNSLLQHGSLPISINSRLCVSLFKYPSENDQARALTLFNKKTTSISEILGSQIGWQELRDAILRGYQEALGIKLHEGILTNEEIELSQKLAREKYNTPAWNHFGNYETEGLRTFSMHQNGGVK